MIRVLVATPLGEGGRGGIDRIMDALRRELARVPLQSVSVSFAATRGPRHIALAPLYLAAAIFRLIALRLAGRLDLLHVNLSSSGSTWRKIVLCRAARLLGTPYVIHLHGSRFRTFFEATGRLSRAEIVAMFRGAGCVLVLGQVWQQFLTAHIPDIASRVHILPNASPRPGPQNPADGTTRILFLGEVGPRKGVPLLLAALSSLRDLDGWCAVIAGNGDLEATRLQLENLGLTDRIKLPGWLGPEQVEDLLAASSLLVLPSQDENLPMSIIEAMGHGLPVVATPVGAVPDIIRHEETGLLVPQGDPAALSAALRRLLTDQDLRHRLGRAAQAFHKANLEIGPYLSRLAAIWSLVACTRGQALSDAHTNQSRRIVDFVIYDLRRPEHRLAPIQGAGRDR